MISRIGGMPKDLNCQCDLERWIQALLGGLWRVLWSMTLMTSAASDSRVCCRLVLHSQVLGHLLPQTDLAPSLHQLSPRSVSQHHERLSFEMKFPLYWHHFVQDYVMESNMGSNKSSPLDLMSDRALSNLCKHLNQCRIQGLVRKERMGIGSSFQDLSFLQDSPPLISKWCWVQHWEQLSPGSVVGRMTQVTVTMFQSFQSWSNCRGPDVSRNIVNNCLQKRQRRTQCISIKWWMIIDLTNDLCRRALSSHLALALVEGLKDLQVQVLRLQQVQMGEQVKHLLER